MKGLQKLQHKNLSVKDCEPHHRILGKCQVFHQLFHYLTDKSSATTDKRIGSFTQKKRALAKGVFDHFPFSRLKSIFDLATRIAFAQRSVFSMNEGRSKNSTDEK